MLEYILIMGFAESNKRCFCHERTTLLLKVGKQTVCNLDVDNLSVVTIKDFGHWDDTVR
jgi:hypothetical protein